MGGGGGGGDEGRQESERGGGGGGSLAIVPVSPCFSPIFHAHNLTHSPPSECRLYVLKVWNRLHYSSQVVHFCFPILHCVYNLGYHYTKDVLFQCSFAIAILHVLSTTGKNNRFHFWIF